MPGVVHLSTAAVFAVRPDGGLLRRAVAYAARTWRDLRHGNSAGSGHGCNRLAKTLSDRQLWFFCRACLFSSDVIDCAYPGPGGRAASVSSDDRIAADPGGNVGTRRGERAKTRERDGGHYCGRGYPDVAAELRLEQFHGSLARHGEEVAAEVARTFRAGHCGVRCSPLWSSSQGI